MRATLRYKGPTSHPPQWTPSPTTLCPLAKLRLIGLMTPLTAETRARWLEELAKRKATLLKKMEHQELAGPLPSYNTSTSAEQLEQQLAEIDKQKVEHLEQLEENLKEDAELENQLKAIIDKEEAERLERIEKLLKEGAELDEQLEALDGKEQEILAAMAADAVSQLSLDTSDAEGQV
ncbi:uncharacterized protein BDZ99DRAFT_480283 [Mytilinidion resinicola]|uniref:Uncharacterized protein n=1 Tax=Mytilinidion resinicola TaxID=574789 RepID=A0A6A6Y9U3_9PEZI|nr:uncharacterized protein BDZ99DRAFT_480283 [Mytilinidion resinicola]KAF2805586.1 hypothetical protein BDZ99DRAFT_480283 [Mytilinidion resinicola]